MTHLNMATDRVQRMLRVIPADHDLAKNLTSRLSSLQFSSPENAGVHIERVCEDLATHIGDPNKATGWGRQVFDIWMS